MSFSGDSVILLNPASLDGLSYLEGAIADIGET